MGFKIREGRKCPAGQTCGSVSDSEVIHNIKE